MSIRRAQVPTNSTKYCVLHTSEIYQRFCTDCNCYVCIDCITGVHQGHNYARIEDADRKIREEVFASIDLLKQLEMRKKKIIDSVQSNQTSYVQQTGDIAEQVLDKAEDIKRSIDVVRDENLAEIDKIKRHDLLFLQDVENSLKEELTELQTYIQSCEENSAFVDKQMLNILIADIKKKLDKYLEMEEFVPISPPGFLSMDTEKDTLKAAYGYIKKMSGERLVMKKIVTVSQDRADVRINDSPESSNQENIYALATFDVKNLPVAIASTGNGNAWVCDAYGNISLFYKDGSQITSVKIDNGVGDIAVTSSGDVIITNFLTNKVIRLAKNGNVVDLIEASPYHPYGVCISSEDEIIVTMRHNSRDGKVVRITNGKITQTIKKGFLLASLFKKPWYITENINQDLWIQDGGLGRVLAINKGGELKCSYKGPTESSLELQFSPVAVTHTMRGHILIVDQGNAAIHQVDAEGSLLAIFASDPTIITPSVIDEDNSCYLWTCSFATKKIMVLKSPR